MHAMTFFFANSATFYLNMALFVLTLFRIEPHWRLLLLLPCSTPMTACASFPIGFGSPPTTRASTWTTPAAKSTPFSSPTTPSWKKSLARSSTKADPSWREPWLKSPKRSPSITWYSFLCLKSWANKLIYEQHIIIASLFSLWTNDSHLRFSFWLEVLSVT